MSELADLFRSEVEDVHTTGVLPSQALKAAISKRHIESKTPIEASQIQPASLDLRLGSEAYRVNASFLPGPEATVHSKLDQLATDSFSLGDGAVLERGCVYIIPLQEQLAATLCELSGLDSVFFCSTGLEANEAALKIARKYGHDRGIARPEVIVSARVESTV